jgi:NADH dehydrogenase
MEIVCRETDRKRLLLPIPWFAAKGMARLTGWLPGAPITLDQVLLLQNDNVVSGEAARDGRTLQGIGIMPRNMDSILPSYLVRFRPQGQFQHRGEA